jgi:hypothetical protein
MIGVSVAQMVISVPTDFSKSSRLWYMHSIKFFLAFKPLVLVNCTSFLQEKYKLKGVFNFIYGNSINGDISYQGF